MRTSRIRGLLPGLFFTALLSGLVGGCAQSGPYQTAATSSQASVKALADRPAASTPCYQPARTGPNGDPVPAPASVSMQPASSTCVRFIEFDDFGNLFNRGQMQETLDAALEVATRGGIVVVYIHGWDHNAASNDTDLINFHQAIQSARTIDGQFSSRRDVLGIYIGWRGQSVTIPLLSKLTFWERKTTAQTVGDGAVFEVLRKLANYREQNVKSRLVLIGHSFGAAIAYSAVSHSITAQIIEDGWKPSNGSTLNQKKRWDMVVLINPAFEAMQLRSQLALAMTQQYPSNQLPHLILITSVADWATGLTFPVGRYLRSVLNSYAGDARRSMYAKAVGHYLPYVTHQLADVDSCSQYRPTARSAGAPDKLSVVFDEKNFCFDDARAWIAGSDKKPAPVRPVLLTRCEAEPDCRRVAPKHTISAPAGMPIVNIRTTRAVMTGHNDIWNPTMRAFLVQLMIKIVERGEQPAR